MRGWEEWVHVGLVLPQEDLWLWSIGGKGYGNQMLY